MKIIVADDKKSDLEKFAILFDKLKNIDREKEKNLLESSLKNPDSKKQHGKMLKLNKLFIDIIELLPPQQLEEIKNNSIRKKI